MSAYLTGFGRFASWGIAGISGRLLRRFLAVLMLAIAGPLAAAHAATDAGTMTERNEATAATFELEHSASEQDDSNVPLDSQHSHCAVCHAPHSMTVRVQDSVVVHASVRVTYRLMNSSDVAKNDPSPLPEPPRS